MVPTRALMGSSRYSCMLVGSLAAASTREGRHQRRRGGLTCKKALRKEGSGSPTRDGGEGFG